MPSPSPPPLPRIHATHSALSACAASVASGTAAHRSSHSFTRPSWLADASRCSSCGLHAMADTQPACGASAAVASASPRRARASHSRTTASPPPNATTSARGARAATACTAFEPLYVSVHTPLPASQRLTLWSHPPEKITPSAGHATDDTQCRWPSSRPVGDSTRAAAAAAALPPPLTLRFLAAAAAPLFSAAAAPPPPPASASAATAAPPRHSSTALSHPHVAAALPDGLTATPSTVSVCPAKDATAVTATASPPSPPSTPSHRHSLATWSRPAVSSRREPSAPAPWTPGSHFAAVTPPACAPDTSATGPDS
eukprot:365102-Chlamydomonas_euryale.AAC.11